VILKKSNSKRTVCILSVSAKGNNPFFISYKILAKFYYNNENFKNEHLLANTDMCIPNIFAILIC